MNKRIKIKPYPNSKITDKCFDRDVKSNSTTQESINNILGNELIMIAEFKIGDRRVLRSNVVENNNGEKFISVSPHPIHIYLDIALENYYNSEHLKNYYFPICANKTNKKIEDLMLLDIDIDSTHHCYNEFIKCKINSIIMLTTALEGFCNSLIPDDYIYITSTGKQLDRDWSQNKARFEVDKIDIMIPEFVNDDDYWTLHSDERKNITDIYKLRNELIHLKTEGIDQVENYSKVIKDVIDVNVYEYIISIIKTFNDLSVKIKGEIFIEFSDEKYINEIDVNKIDFDFINLYLKLKDIQIHSYFNKSKNKIKNWENNGIPKEYINFFITQEGKNINQIIYILSSKYTD